MKLVDTSSWIDALRKDGDQAIQARVLALLCTGEAAWCDMVRLELWNGVRGAAERKHLEGMEADLTLLPMTDGAWAKARLLAQRARAKGITVPGPDLVIAGCAWEHGVAMEHDDAHLAALASLMSR
jgi:predicted nucleic acid-binding protein